MIVAQRAYEANSKSITASDEMLQTANQVIR
jgi:flagellar basal-body rod protein FlgG